MPEQEIGLQSNQGQNVQNTEVQAPPEPSSVAPGIDSELDAALEKAFNIPPEVVEQPKSQPAEPKTSQKIEAPNQEVKENKNVQKSNDPLPDPDSIKDDVGNSKSTKDGWNALKNNYKTAKNLVSERDQKIEKLEKALAERANSTAKEMQELKSQLEETNKFRAMVDLQADPEFITKYEQPIENTLNSIKSMLKDMNVTDEVIGQIDFTNTKLMDTILDHVGQHEDKFKARKLQRNIEQLIELSDKKEETLLDHKNKYKEYIENKKKEGFTLQSENEGRVLKHVETVSNTKDVNGNPLYAFLVKKEIGDTMDDLARNQINVHNTMVDAMNKKLNQFLSFKTPEEQTEVAIAAVGAHYLSAQLKAVMKQNEALQSEIKKISAVTTENEDPKPKRVASNKSMDVDSALNEFFNAR